VRRRNGSMARMRRFFEANPEEELTYEDVRAKFDLSDRTAYARVQEAIEEGWLRRETVIRFNPPKEAP
jgi:hypothetical protein